MGTEILRRQDCLFDRLRLSPAACSHRRHGGYNYNARFNRKPVRSEQRKRSEPTICKRSSSVDDMKTVRNNLVVEKVITVRRGESSGLRIRNGKSLKRKADRLVPNLEIVPREIRIVDIRFPQKTDVYAGSAFVVSPAPSSLPLPSFSTKKQAQVYNSATRDLRRLLRLDL
ncbi:hypothetical protein SLEP1_g248 [Rubroshorea leprosula]|uniref:Uncharacterized protein n=1 Tax=Rubroshorea leprosula TaxID=152421 RepID=A0AAV5HIN7_9ROSI|nr:hypothetical protein SLEP1_g248 [Rubroshorea leprosula]